MGIPLLCGFYLWLVLLNTSASSTALLWVPLSPQVEGTGWKDELCACSPIIIRTVTGITKEYAAEGQSHADMAQLSMMFSFCS